MKQRLVPDNTGVEANIESIEKKVEHKILRSHRWLRFVKRFRNKINKKLLYVGCFFLFIFSVVCILFYLGNATIPNNEKANVIDADYVLPIGTATDKDYYITRPNGRDDGGVVRVMFVMVSTHVDQTLCYAVASAYFTNIPVIVTGYNVKNFKMISKPSRYLHTAEEAGLQDNDVVIALDSDIMFTGLDYFPFIDKFIKLSPANLNELDAKAVRTREALPPVMYGTEKNCFSPQTLSHPLMKCHTAYEQLYQKHNEYVDSLTEFAEKPFVNYDDNELEHINSGTSIHRVWAMRKLFPAFYKFMEDNKPLDDREWWCDQSVFTKLYLELRLWEIEQDYFRKHTDELRTMSNEYGLYAGLIGLDLKGELSVLIHPTLTIEIFYITTEQWQTSKSEEIESINVFDENKDSFVRKWYNKTGVKELFTQRKLSRSYSNVHSVTIAPPLLSVVPRHINGKDKPAERVYPPLIHFSGSSKGSREANALNYMQWSLPMMFDKEEWKRGKHYAMSMPIELWTGNDEKLRLRYGDICRKHPFNFNIKR